MAYEIYKRKLSMDDYYATWDSENYKRLNDMLKQQIYAKYLMKCEVFQRDNFKCLNTECKNPDSQLTVHHVKFQKNGGKDSPRNCVTLCRTCHQGYHKGSREIVYPNHDYLPNSVRGHTHKLIKEDTINWKQVKAEMKILRKSLMDARIYLSWEQIAILMKFLEMNFDEDDD